MQYMVRFNLHKISEHFKTPYILFSLKGSRIFKGIFVVGCKSSFLFVLSTQLVDVGLKAHEIQGQKYLCLGHLEMLSK